MQRRLIYLLMSEAPSENEFSQLHRNHSNTEKYAWVPIWEHMSSSLLWLHMRVLSDTSSTLVMNSTLRSRASLFKRMVQQRTPTSVMHKLVNNHVQLNIHHYSGKMMISANNFIVIRFSTHARKSIPILDQILRLDQSLRPPKSNSHNCIIS